MKQPNHLLSSADVSCALTGFTSKTSGGTVYYKVDPRHAIEGFNVLNPTLHVSFLITTHG